MNNRILVVFTGGTIGSKKGADGVIDVDNNAGYELTRRYDNTANIVFDTINPYNILSENILPRHFELLVNSIADCDIGKYDGIIITHGTDTLPYTAAFMSFVLGDLKLPVVFVSADKPLEDPVGNGFINFAGAVDFITGARIPGVFGVIKNSENRVMVYLGTRILEADYIHDRFASYKDGCFGEIKNGGFVPGDIQLGCSGRTMVSIPKISVQNNIAAIRVYPGLDYSVFNFEDTRVRAVLHTLYHSSTAYTAAPGKHSLITFADKCRGMNIDLYLYDCRHFTDSGVYSSANELIKTGIYPLTNISFEAAFAKLYAAYNQTALPPNEYMQQNIFYEYV